MEECYIGAIMPWAGYYAPRGWMFCHGQSLRIAEHSALFAVIGTMYGGNGTSHFNLPDLRGQVILGAGQSARTGTYYTAGQKGGTESVKVDNSNLPPHTHTINSTVSVTPVTNTVSMEVRIPVNTEEYNGDTATNTPGSDCTLGMGKTSNKLPTNIYTREQPTTGANLKPFTISGDIPSPAVTVSSACNSNVTANNPIPIMQSYTVLNYIICIEGLFPPRD